jgi:hypothetical protein
MFNLNLEGKLGANTYFAKLLSFLKDTNLAEDKSTSLLKYNFSPSCNFDLTDFTNKDLKPIFKSPKPSRKLLGILESRLGISQMGPLSLEELVQL